MKDINKIIKYIEKQGFKIIKFREWEYLEVYEIEIKQK